MEKKTMKPLTRAEMDVMNVLWDAPQALTVNEIVERYAEPQPAYTTVGTFLKILEAKGGTSSQGGHRAHFLLFAHALA